MKHDDKQAIALWRLGVLGPLTSARLEHGDRRRYIDEAAARIHERPDGRRIRLSARTIEIWYYAYRRGGFKALFPGDRKDRGQSRAISAEVAERILRVKRERPRRSIQRIIRMLERARIVRAGELHRSTVHRLLAAHDASARPLRGPGTERRSFLHEHAGDLWAGDAMHGPKAIAPDGSLRKSYLLSQIDGATRYMPHSYFALSEKAADQEYGFKQAVAKHGPPRTYYVDLSGFLNFAFDSRDLLTMWLVGLPPLTRHLRMQQHAPLGMRVVYQVHLEPLDRDLFRAMIDHSLEAVGATQTVLADPARELLFRASRGVPRVASNLLRQALREAHECNQTFIDDHTMEVAIDASPSAQAAMR